MSYVLFVRDEAQDETEEIRKWYEAQSAGLGVRFVDALEKTYRSLCDTPYYQVRKDVYRYVRVEGFPFYRVVYVVDGNMITVYQVRHTSRKPSRKFGP